MSQPKEQRAGSHLVLANVPAIHQFGAVWQRGAEGHDLNVRCISDEVMRIRDGEAHARMETHKSNHVPFASRSLCDDNTRGADAHLGHSHSPSTINAATTFEDRDID